MSLERMIQRSQRINEHINDDKCQLNYLKVLSKLFSGLHHYIDHTSYSSDNEIGCFVDNIADCFECKHYICCHTSCHRS